MVKPHEMVGMKKPNECALARALHTGHSPLATQDYFTFVALPVMTLVQVLPSVEVSKL